MERVCLKHFHNIFSRYWYWKSLSPEFRAPSQCGTQYNLTLYLSAFFCPFTIGKSLYGIFCYLILTAILHMYFSAVMVCLLYFYTLFLVFGGGIV